MKLFADPYRWSTPADKRPREVSAQLINLASPAEASGNAMIILLGILGAIFIALDVIAQILSAPRPYSLRANLKASLLDSSPNSLSCLAPFPSQATSSLEALFLASALHSSSNHRSSSICSADGPSLACSLLALRSRLT